MAAKTLNAAAFMAALVAPLPPKEIASADFITDLLRDWRAGMEGVQYAEHGHFHQAIGLRRAIPGHSERISRQYCHDYRDAIGKQCLIPAPTDKELRWKKRNLHLVADRDREAVAKAMARDEARLSLVREG